MPVVVVEPGEEVGGVSACVFEMLEGRRKSG